MRDVIFMMIGAGLTFGFQFYLEFWKAKRYEKQMLYDERKKVYERIMEGIASFHNFVKDGNKTNEKYLKQASEIFFAIQPQALLYASSDICKRYTIFIEKFEHGMISFDDLATALRKEIGNDKLPPAM
jgi:hypothetical protein